METVERTVPALPIDGEVTDRRGDLSLRWTGDHGTIAVTFNKGKAVVLSFQQLVVGGKGTPPEVLKYFRK